MSSQRNRQVTFLLCAIGLSISFQNCGSVEKVAPLIQVESVFDHGLQEYDPNVELWADSEPRDNYLDIALHTKDMSATPRQDFVVVGTVASANLETNRVEYEVAMFNQFGQSVCPRQRGVLEKGATSFRVFCESQIRSRVLQVRLSAIVNGEVIRVEKLF